MDQAIARQGWTRVLEKRSSLAVRPWEALLIGVICLAVTGMEWIFAYKDPAYGIITALGVVLAIYMLVSALRPRQSISNVADSLSLLPLYVLLSASLPWFFVGQNYLMPAVYTCVLALCLWHIQQRKLSLSAIVGFSRQGLLKYVFWGVLLGAPMGIIEYFILTPTPAGPVFDPAFFIRTLIYMVFFVGLGEEVLFRGIIQRDFGESFGWKWGVVLSAYIFAMMHLTWRSVPELGFVFIVGLLLGYVYHRTGSLTIPITMHATVNVVLIGVMPYIFHTG